MVARLGSDELNRLVDQALANNQDLRIAVLRIAQAQARADQAYAQQFPVITAPMQGHHDSPSNGINSATGFGTAKDRQYVQGGARGDWRVDLWGELSAQSDSAEMQMWRATYQRDDTRRTLIASVASQYVEYLSLNDRLRVAHETEAALQALLDAVSARLAVGDATVIELEQQRAAVLVVQATIPGLELQRENAVNALALLLGVTPSSLALSDHGIDSLSFPGVAADVP
ncbi:TolC family protein, partial [Methylogaea oryzae]|uniref:TolC family protein n=1 Tax=Methylogaea oryzae TaxID=1295382 RepID=UPI00138F9BF0